MDCFFNKIFNDPIYEFIKNKNYKSIKLINDSNNFFMNAFVQFINRMREFIQYVINDYFFDNLKTLFSETTRHHIIILLKYLNNHVDVDISDIVIKIKKKTNIPKSSQNYVIDFIDNISLVD